MFGQQIAVTHAQWQRKLLVAPEQQKKIKMKFFQMNATEVERMNQPELPAVYYVRRYACLGITKKKKIN